MSRTIRQGDFGFDCIVERPRSAPFGGRFAILVTLLILLIVIAAIFPAQRANPHEAGAPAIARAG